MMYIVYIGWYDAPGVDFIQCFHSKEAAEKLKKMLDVSSHRPVFVAEVQIGDEDVHQGR